eukprot:CAMPEP_0179059306 /NCGR_PEP_ID=MMETSP0796-20121207/25288_1 /TAXON_ID=73915 /ORGANISM="Pyrodinium bahamense, Strain pbaha01" /LENGTH=335 /DNA_ID=CAMNT_0020756065 /DNA_START=1 /DNA_END=1008 /DNA_ORIENTATION=-
MGAVVSKVCHLAFMGLLTVNTTWAAGCMQIVHCLPLSRKIREGCSLMLVQVAWRLTLLFAPWVWRTAAVGDNKRWDAVLAGLERSNAEAASRNAPHRPLFILGNHTSFLDAMVSSASFPSRVLWRCRTYMDRHLFQLPVLATVCHSVGHFPVHFKSDQSGAFKVDAAKMELVEKQVAEHLGQGGWLCFFPEGQINRDPDRLMPFRFGGMKRALEFDALLVSFVTCGNNTVWPRKVLVGGLPGKVNHSLRVLAPDGTRAFVADLRRRGLPEEEQGLPDHELLARHTHAQMQQQYDELKAAPGSRCALVLPCLALLVASAGVTAVVVAGLRAARARV